MTIKKILISLIVAALVIPLSISNVMARTPPPTEITPAEAPLNYQKDPEGRYVMIVKLAAEPLVTPPIGGASDNFKRPLTQPQTINNPLSPTQLMLAEHNVAFNRIKSLIPNAQRVSDFYYTLNGLAVAVPKNDIAKLRTEFGSNNVFFSEIHELDLGTSVPLIGANTVWNPPYNTDGTGTVVGVIDTGIDYTHPDLGGTTTPPASLDPAYPARNSRVIAGIQTGGAGTTPDPMDSQGHGTHVAGIMAANGVVKGVAPGAKIVAAKITEGAGGSAATVDMIEAFEWVTMLKVTHLINLVAVNLSFGSWGGFVNPADPMQVSMSNTWWAGIFVAASAGNNSWSINGSWSINQIVLPSQNPAKNTYYPADIGIVGHPSTTAEVVSVASTNNTHVPSLLETTTTIRYDYLLGSPSLNPVAVLGTGPLEYVNCLFGQVGEFPAGVAGKIALISRGIIPFRAKVDNAIAAGAIGVVIYNNVAGTISMSLAGTPALPSIPAVSIRQDAGTALIAALPAGRIRFDGVGMPAPADEADKMSSFTSWGTPPGMQAKPDVSAPGGNIFSTYPLALGGYALLGGTSMAAPHVAGVAALLSQRGFPYSGWGLAPLYIKDALLNTAIPRTHHTSGIVFGPRVQGAGRIDALLAFKTMTGVYDPLSANTPPSIALGDLDAETGSKTFHLAAYNLSVAPITYNLSSVVVMHNNLRVPNVLSGASVSFTDMADAPITQLIVPAGGDIMFKVTVTIGASIAFYNVFAEGFIYLTDSAATEPQLSVPFTLFIGDFENTQATSTFANNPIFDPPWTGFSSSGFWWWGWTWPRWNDAATLRALGVNHLGTTWDKNNIAISPGTVNPPTKLRAKANLHPTISLMKGAAELKIDLYNEADTTLIQSIFTENWVRKNYQLTAPERRLWSGWDSSWLWSATTVADGNYTLRLTAKTATNVDGESGTEVLSFPLKVDRVAPTVNITEALFMPDGRLRITFTSSDDRSGVWGFRPVLNGTAQALQAPTSTTYTFPLAATTSTFEFEVYDNAGNVNTYNCIPAGTLILRDPHRLTSLVIYPSTCCEVQLVNENAPGYASPILTNPIFKYCVKTSNLIIIRFFNTRFYLTAHFRNVGGYWTGSALFRDFLAPQFFWILR